MKDDEIKKVIYSAIILIGIILSGCSSDTGSVNEVSSGIDGVPANLDIVAPEQKSRLSSFPPLPQMPKDD